MINYFDKKLESILNSRRTIAKERAQKNYEEILAAHPDLKEKIKIKKISRTRSFEKYRAQKTLRGNQRASFGYR